MPRKPKRSCALSRMSQADGREGRDQSERRKVGSRPRAAGELQGGDPTAGNLQE